MEQDKCTMWIWPAENAAPTFHSCLLSQRVIDQFIALIAIKPIAKTAPEIVVEWVEDLAPQGKCTASTYPAVNAVPRSRNYHSNLLETSQFIAEPACKLAETPNLDSKIKYPSLWRVFYFLTITKSLTV